MGFFLKKQGLIFTCSLVHLQLNDCSDLLLWLIGLFKKQVQPYLPLPALSTSQSLTDCWKESHDWDVRFGTDVSGTGFHGNRLKCNQSIKIRLLLILLKLTNKLCGPWNSGVMFVFFSTLWGFGAIKLSIILLSAIIRNKRTGLGHFYLNHINIGLTLKADEVHIKLCVQKCYTILYKYI